MIVRNDKSIGNEKLSYKEMTSPEFSSFKPAQEVKPVEQSNGSPEETGMGRRPDLLSRVCEYLMQNRVYLAEFINRSII